MENNNQKYFRNTYFVEVALQDWNIKDCQKNPEIVRLNFWFPKTNATLNIYVRREEILNNNNPFKKSVRLWNNKGYFVISSIGDKIEAKEMWDGNFLIHNLYNFNDKEYISEHAYTFAELNFEKQEKVDKNAKPTTGKTAIKYSKL